MGISPPSPALSIVIPCWNDAEALGSVLGTISLFRGVAEVIVADASNTDACAEIGKHFGATVVRCGKPSRGAQMNAGARVATGDVLLFQHADTELTQEHVDSLLAVASEERIAGGAFHRKFDDRHARLRWLEPLARLWSGLGGSFYGDQSIFARRNIFEQMGGYADYPLMEDLDFCRRIRSHGRTILLDPPIGSSPRQARRYGAWRTSIRNAALISLYYAGVSPHTLHRWYYRLPASGVAARAGTPAVAETS